MNLSALSPPYRRTKILKLFVVCAAALIVAGTLPAQKPRATVPVKDIRSRMFAAQKTGPKTRSMDKTFFDYFRESAERLSDHPNADINAQGFKYDALLAGEWISPNAITHGKVYGIYFNGYTFREDGTGVFQRTVHTLRKNMQLAHNPAEDLDYPFVWGVEVAYTENQEPVTLVRVAFEDGTWMRMYYAAFEQDDGKRALGFVYFDEETQRPVNEKTILYPGADVLADWEQNQEVVRQSVVDFYKKKKALDDSIMVQQMMRNEMTNHMLFMNTMNIGWCGMPVS